MIKSRSVLEQYYFERFILDVAIATLECGGVTSNPLTYQFLAPIDAWALPKCPEKTLILQAGDNIQQELRRFIELNALYWHEPETWLGTWIHPQTQCCHIDITTILFDLEIAKREALYRSKMASRNIIALYNFKQQRTVYLDMYTQASL